MAEGGGDAGMAVQPQDGESEVAMTRGALAVRTWDRSSSHHRRVAISPAMIKMTLPAP
jgi:hypothetical protein